MPKAREGKAKRFVMAVENSAGDQLSPASFNGASPNDRFAPSYWYKVPRRVTC